VVLKFTPQLSFKLDGSVERGVRTLSILEALEEGNVNSTGDEGAVIDGEKLTIDEANGEMRRHDEVGESRDA
jgi:hypothetical protein